MPKTFKRLTSFLTLLSFFFTQLGISPQAWAETSSPSEVALVRPAFQLDLPSEFGTVEAITSGSGPTLIHIQEAHGNYEAQKKIQSILHHLKDQYDVKLVLVEGNAFRLRPELLRFFPDRMDLTMKILEDLAQKSVITGPELFLAEEKEAQGYGVEDLKTYVLNGAAFKEVLAKQQETSNFLKDMDMAIERLTSPYLNKNLRAFLKRVEAFEAKQVPFEDWLNELKNEAKKHLEADLENPAFQADWPMLLRVFKLNEFESKLNLAAFQTEKIEFLKTIASVPEETRKEVEKLLSAPRSEHRLSDPETGLLFERMIAALPEDFNYAAYPNVNLFIGHLVLKSELKGKELVDEIELLSETITETLAVTGEEKKIIELLADHRLLKKLFALELVPEEYDKIQNISLCTGKCSESVRPSKLIERFLALNGDKRVKNFEFKHTEEINTLFDKALEFYRLAAARDEIMIKNVENRMKETGLDKAVIITGGFHAQPFRQFFDEKDYNYALISPKITSAEGRENYVKTILQDFLMPDSPMAATYGVTQRGAATIPQVLNHRFNPAVSEAQILAGIYDELRAAGETEAAANQSIDSLPRRKQISKPVTVTAAQNPTTRRRGRMVTIGDDGDDDDDDKWTVWVYPDGAIEGADAERFSQFVLPESQIDADLAAAVSPRGEMRDIVKRESIGNVVLETDIDHAQYTIRTRVSDPQEPLGVFVSYDHTLSTGDIRKDAEKFHNEVTDFILFSLGDYRARLWAEYGEHKKPRYSAVKVDLDPALRPALNRVLQVLQGLNPEVNANAFRGDSFDVSVNNPIDQGILESLSFSISRNPDLSGGAPEFQIVVHERSRIGTSYSHPFASAQNPDQFLQVIERILATNPVNDIDGYMIPIEELLNQWKPAAARAIFHPFNEEFSGAIDNAILKAAGNSPERKRVNVYYDNGIVAVAEVENGAFIKDPKDFTPGWLAANYIQRNETPSSDVLYSLTFKNGQLVIRKEKITFTQLIAVLRQLKNPDLAELVTKLEQGLWSVGDIRAALEETGIARPENRLELSPEEWQRSETAWQQLSDIIRQMRGMGAPSHKISEAQELQSGLSTDEVTPRKLKGAEAFIRLHRPEAREILDVEKFRTRMEEGTVTSQTDIVVVRKNGTQEAGYFKRINDIAIVVTDDDNLETIIPLNEINNITVPYRTEMRTYDAETLMGELEPFSRRRFLTTGFATAGAAAVLGIASQAPAQTSSTGTPVQIVDQAKATYRGMAALVDPKHGVAVDRATITDQNKVKLVRSDADYMKTSPTSIGLGVASVVIAREQGWMGAVEAEQQITAAVATLEKMEKMGGFWFNWYDLRGSAPKVALNRFVSSVDNANLTAALMAARDALDGRPVAARIQRLLDAQDWNFFYNKKLGLMNHGWDDAANKYSKYNYDTFNTEARLLALIAVLNGVDEAAWNNMSREVRADNAKKPLEERILVVAPWGGSLFETLFADVFIGAPGVIGENNRDMITIHRNKAGELGYSIWGWSPALNPDGVYQEFAVPEVAIRGGGRGYPVGAVSPYSALLAGRYFPREVAANLAGMRKLNPAVYHPNFGYRDTIDPKTGAVAPDILSLDQGLGLAGLDAMIQREQRRRGTVERYFWGYLERTATAVAARTMLNAEEEKFAQAMEDYRKSQASPEEKLEKKFDFIRESIETNDWFTLNEGRVAHFTIEDADRSRVFEIQYNVDPSGSYNGTYHKQQNVRPADYKATHLVIGVKGDRDAGYTKSFKIDLKSGGRVVQTFVIGDTDKGIPEVSDEWQDIQFPLNQEAQNAGIDEVVTIFEHDRAGDATQGVIDISDISLAAPARAEVRSDSPAEFWAGRMLDEIRQKYESSEEMATHWVVLPTIEKILKGSPPALNFDQLTEIREKLLAYWRSRGWNVHRLNTDILFMSLREGETAVPYFEGEEKLWYLTGGNLDETLIRDLTNGLAVVLHLRWFGFHEDQELSDYDVLVKTLRRFIPSLIVWRKKEHPERPDHDDHFKGEFPSTSYETFFLWALAVMLDPVIFDREVSFSTSFSTSRSSEDIRREIAQRFVPIFQDLKEGDGRGQFVESGVKGDDLESLLIDALSKTEEDWWRAGLVSPWDYQMTARPFMQRHLAEFDWMRREVAPYEAPVLNAIYLMPRFPVPNPNSLDPNHFRNATLEKFSAGYANVELAQKEVFLQWPEMKEVLPGLESKLMQRLSPHRVWDPDQYLERRYFIELLHLLNRNWWLMEGEYQGNLYRDKTALEFQGDMPPNIHAIMSWSDKRFAQAKRDVEDIVRHRIEMGKFADMIVADYRHQRADAKLLFRLGERLHLRFSLSHRAEARLPGERPGSKRGLSRQAKAEVRSRWEAKVSIPSTATAHHSLSIAVQRQQPVDIFYSIVLTPNLFFTPEITGPADYDDFETLAGPPVSFPSEVIPTKVTSPDEAQQLFDALVLEADRRIKQGLWKTPFGTEYGEYKQWIRTNYPRAEVRAQTVAISEARQTLRGKSERRAEWPAGFPALQPWNRASGPRPVGSDPRNGAGSRGRRFDAGAQTLLSEGHEPPAGQKLGAGPTSGGNILNGDFPLLEKSPVTAEGPEVKTDGLFDIAERLLASFALGGAAGQLGNINAIATLGFFLDDDFVFHGRNDNQISPQSQPSRAEVRAMKRVQLRLGSGGELVFGYWFELEGTEATPVLRYLDESYDVDNPFQGWANKFPLRAGEEVILGSAQNVAVTMISFQGKTATLEVEDRRAEVREVKGDRRQSPALDSRRKILGRESLTTSLRERTSVSSEKSLSLTSTMSSQSVPVRSETRVSSVLKPSTRVPTSAAENDLPFAMGGNLASNPGHVNIKYKNNLYEEISNPARAEVRKQIVGTFDEKQQIVTLAIDEEQINASSKQELIQGLKQWIDKGILPQTVQISDRDPHTTAMQEWQFYIISEFPKERPGERSGYIVGWKDAEDVAQILNAARTSARNKPEIKAVESVFDLKKRFWATALEHEGERLLIRMNETTWHYGGSFNKGVIDPKRPMYDFLLNEDPSGYLGFLTLQLNEEGKVIGGEIDLKERRDPDNKWRLLLKAWITQLQGHKLNRSHPFLKQFPSRVLAGGEEPIPGGATPIYRPSRSETRAITKAEAIRRVDEGLKRNYRAGIHDIDGNLTPSHNREVSPEAIVRIRRKLLAGIPQGLASGRVEIISDERKRAAHQIGISDYLDIAEVAGPIRAGLPPEAQVLFFEFPEQASYAVWYEDGVRQEKDLVKKYLAQSFSGIEPDRLAFSQAEREELYQAMADHLSQDFPQPFRFLEGKRYGLAAYVNDKPDWAQEGVSQVANRMAKKLEDYLQSETFRRTHPNAKFQLLEVFATSIGVDFMIRGIDKGLPLRFFQDRFGFDIDEIVGTDDKAGRRGNGWALTHHRAGFSTHEYDPESANQIPLSLAWDLSGIDAWLRLDDQLNYRSRAEARVEPADVNALHDVIKRHGLGNSRQAILGGLYKIFDMVVDEKFQEARQELVLLQGFIMPVIKKNLKAVTEITQAFQTIYKKFDAATAVEKQKASAEKTQSLHETIRSKKDVLVRAIFDRVLAQIVTPVFYPSLDSQAQKTQFLLDLKSQTLALHFKSSGPNSFRVIVQYGKNSGKPEEEIKAKQAITEPLQMKGSVYELMRVLTENKEIDPKKNYGFLIPAIYGILFPEESLSKSQVTTLPAPGKKVSNIAEVKDIDVESRLRDWISGKLKKQQQILVIQVLMNGISIEKILTVAGLTQDYELQSAKSVSKTGVKSTSEGLITQRDFKTWQLSAGDFVAIALQPKQRAEVRNEKQDDWQSVILAERGETADLFYHASGQSFFFRDSEGDPLTTARALLQFQIPSSKGEAIEYHFEWPEEESYVAVLKNFVWSDMSNIDRIKQFKKYAFRDEHAKLIDADEEVSIDDYFSLRREGTRLQVKRLISKGPESGEMVVKAPFLRRAEVRREIEMVNGVGGDLNSFQSQFRQGQSGRWQGELILAAGALASYISFFVSLAGKIRATTRKTTPSPNTDINWTGQLYFKKYPLASANRKESRQVSNKVFATISRLSSVNTFFIVPLFLSSGRVIVYYNFVNNFINKDKKPKPLFHRAEVRGQEEKGGWASYLSADTKLNIRWMELMTMLEQEGVDREKLNARLEEAWKSPEQKPVVLKVFELIKASHAGTISLAALLIKKASAQNWLKLLSHPDLFRSANIANLLLQTVASQNPWEGIRKEFVSDNPEVRYSLSMPRTFFKGEYEEIGNQVTAFLNEYLSEIKTFSDPEDDSPVYQAGITGLETFQNTPEEVLLSSFPSRSTPPEELKRYFGNLPILRVYSQLPSRGGMGVTVFSAPLPWLWDGRMRSALLKAIRSDMEVEGMDILGYFISRQSEKTFEWEGRQGLHALDDPINPYYLTTFSELNDEIVSYLDSALQHAKELREEAPGYLLYRFQLSNDSFLLYAWENFPGEEARLVHSRYDGRQKIWKDEWASPSSRAEVRNQRSQAESIFRKELDKQLGEGRVARKRIEEILNALHLEIPFEAAEATSEFLARLDEQLELIDSRYPQLHQGWNPKEGQAGFQERQGIIGELVGIMLAGRLPAIAIGIRFDDKAAYLGGLQESAFKAAIAAYMEIKKFDRIDKVFGRQSRKKLVEFLQEKILQGQLQPDFDSVKAHLQGILPAELDPTPIIGQVLSGRAEARVSTAPSTAAQRFTEAVNVKAEELGVSDYFKAEAEGGHNVRLSYFDGKSWRSTTNTYSFFDDQKVESFLDKAKQKRPVPKLDAIPLAEAKRLSQLGRAHRGFHNPSKEEKARGESLNEAIQPHLPIDLRRAEARVTRELNLSIGEGLVVSLPGTETNRDIHILLDGNRTSNNAPREMTVETRLHIYASGASTKDKRGGAPSSYWPNAYETLFIFDGLAASRRLVIGNKPEEIENIVIDYAYDRKYSASKQHSTSTSMKFRVTAPNGTKISTKEEWRKRNYPEIQERIEALFASKAGQPSRHQAVNALLQLGLPKETGIVDYVLKDFQRDLNTRWPPSRLDGKKPEDDHVALFNSVVELRTRAEVRSKANGWVSFADGLSGRLQITLQQIKQLLNQSRSSFYSSPALSVFSFSGVMSQPNSSIVRSKSPNPTPAQIPNLANSSVVMAAGKRIVNTLRKVFPNISRRLGPNRVSIRGAESDDNINKLSGIVNGSFSRSEIRASWDELPAAIGQLVREIIEKETNLVKRLLMTVNIEFTYSKPPRSFTVGTVRAANVLSKSEALQKLLLHQIGKAAQKEIARAMGLPASFIQRMDVQFSLEVEGTKIIIQRSSGDESQGSPVHRAEARASLEGVLERLEYMVRDSVQPNATDLAATAEDLGDEGGAIRLTVPKNGPETSALSDLVSDARSNRMLVVFGTPKRNPDLTQYVFYLTPAQFKPIFEAVGSAIGNANPDDLIQPLLKIRQHAQNTKNTSLFIESSLHISQVSLEGTEQQIQEARTFVQTHRSSARAEVRQPLRGGETEGSSAQRAAAEVRSLAPSGSFSSFPLQLREQAEIPEDARRKLSDAVPVMKKVIMGAGQKIRRWRQEPREELKQGYKKGREIVTAADIAIQSYVLDSLEGKLEFPFRVVAEEMQDKIGKRIKKINDKNKESPWEIVIDPIDGTAQFLDPQSTHFGSLLSLIYQGEVVAAFFIAPEYQMPARKDAQGTLFAASRLDNKFTVSGVKDEQILYTKVVDSHQGSEEFTDRTIVMHKIRKQEEFKTEGFNIQTGDKEAPIPSTGLMLALLAYGGIPNSTRKFKSRGKDAPWSDDVVAYLSESDKIWDVSAGIFFAELVGMVAINLDQRKHSSPLRNETYDRTSQRISRFAIGHPKVVERLMGYSEQANPIGDHRAEVRQPLRGGETEGSSAQRAAAEVRADALNRVNDGNVSPDAGRTNQAERLPRSSLAERSVLRKPSRVLPSVSSPLTVSQKNQGVKSRSQYTAEEKEWQAPLGIEDQSSQIDRKGTQEHTPRILSLPLIHSEHGDKAKAEMLESQYLFSNKSISKSRSEARTDAEPEAEMKQRISEFLRPADRGQAAVHLLELAQEKIARNDDIQDLIRREKINYSPESDSSLLLSALARMIVNRPYHFIDKPISSYNLHSRSMQRIKDALMLGILKEVTVFGNRLIENGRLQDGSPVDESNAARVAEDIQKEIFSKAPRDDKGYLIFPLYDAVWERGYTSFTVSSPTLRAEVRVGDNWEVLASLLVGAGLGTFLAVKGFRFLQKRIDQRKRVEKVLDEKLRHVSIPESLGLNTNSYPQMEFIRVIRRHLPQSLVNEVDSLLRSKQDFQLSLKEVPKGPVEIWDRTRSVNRENVPGIFYAAISIIPARAEARVEGDIIKVTNPFGKRLWLTFDEGIKLLKRDLVKGEKRFLNIDMGHIADITGTTIVSDGERILIKSDSGNYIELVQQTAEEVEIKDLSGQFIFGGSSSSMKPEDKGTEKFFWVDDSVNYLRLIEPGRYTKKDLEKAKQQMQLVSAADIALRAEVRHQILSLNKGENKSIDGWSFGLVEVAAGSVTLRYMKESRDDDESFRNYPQTTSFTRKGESRTLTSEFATPVEVTFIGFVPSKAAVFEVRSEVRVQISLRVGSTETAGGFDLQLEESGGKPFLRYWEADIDPDSIGAGYGVSRSELEVGKELRLDYGGTIATLLSYKGGSATLQIETVRSEARNNDEIKKLTRKLSEILAKRGILPDKVDLIMVFGSSDPKVPEEAARLYQQGRASHILVSGRFGKHIVEDGKTTPEAHIYRDKLIQLGVPGDAILVEDQSKDMRQNASLSLELLRQKNLIPKTAILIHSPFLQIRGAQEARTVFQGTEIYDHAAYIPEIPEQESGLIKMAGRIVQQADKIIERFPETERVNEITDLKVQLQGLLTSRAEVREITDQEANNFSVEISEKLKQEFAGLQDQAKEAWLSNLSDRLFEIILDRYGKGLTDEARRIIEWEFYWRRNVEGNLFSVTYDHLSLLNIKTTSGKSQHIQNLSLNSNSLKILIEIIQDAVLHPDKYRQQPLPAVNREPRPGLVSDPEDLRATVNQLAQEIAREIREGMIKVYLNGEPFVQTGVEDGSSHINPHTSEPALGGEVMLRIGDLGLHQPGDSYRIARDGNNIQIKTVRAEVRGLVLARKLEEKIVFYLGNDPKMVVSVIGIRENKLVRLAFDADKRVEIWRKNIFDQRVNLGQPISQVDLSKVSNVDPNAPIRGLALGQREGQSIIINNEIVVKVVAVDSDRVQLDITAPETLRITQYEPVDPHRAEVRSKGLSEEAKTEVLRLVDAFGFQERSALGQLAEEVRSQIVNGELAEADRTFEKIVTAIKNAVQQLRVVQARNRLRELRGEMRDQAAYRDFEKLFIETVDAFIRLRPLGAEDVAIEFRRLADGGQVKMSIPSIVRQNFPDELGERAFPLVAEKLVRDTGINPLVTERSEGDVYDFDLMTDAATFDELRNTYLLRLFDGNIQSLKDAYSHWTYGDIARLIANRAADHLRSVAETRGVDAAVTRIRHLGFSEEELAPFADSIRQDDIEPLIKDFVVKRLGEQDFSRPEAREREDVGLKAKVDAVLTRELETLSRVFLNGLVPLRILAEFGRLVYEQVIKRIVGDVAAVVKQTAAALKPSVDEFIQKSGLAELFNSNRAADAPHVVIDHVQALPLTDQILAIVAFLFKNPSVKYVLMADGSLAIDRFRGELRQAAQERLDVDLSQLPNFEIRGVERSKLQTAVHRVASATEEPVALIATNAEEVNYAPDLVRISATPEERAAAVIGTSQWISELLGKLSRDVFMTVHKARDLFQSRWDSLVAELQRLTLFLKSA